MPSIIITEAAHKAIRDSATPAELESFGTDTLANGEWRVTLSWPVFHALRAQQFTDESWSDTIIRLFSTAKGPQ